MSYTPQTWANGDIITATKLNNIESGVQSVSNSYTPTTWVNGDIITAVKLNNIEQGIANAGGGGSSDFSTAEVTIVSDGLSFIQFGGINVEDGVMYESIYVPSPSGNDVVTVVLYQGQCTLTNIEEYSLSVSGDISYDIDMDNYLITGDCTITIS